MLLTLQSEKEMFKLESRRKVYNLVKKFSGCNFHELERKSNIPLGTIKYHLDYLAKHKVIEIQRDGNKLRYFPTEITSNNKKLLVLLRQRTIRNILLYSINHKECQQKEIIDFTQLAHSTVSWYLARLVKDNILSLTSKPTGLYYSLLVNKSEILSLLITYKESFFDNLVDQTIEMWSGYGDKNKQ